MSRSLKSALAIAAFVVTLGLTAGPASASASGLPIHIDGSSGCCRIIE